MLMRGRCRMVLCTHICAPSRDAFRHPQPWSACITNLMQNAAMITGWFSRASLLRSGCPAPEVATAALRVLFFYARLKRRQHSFCNPAYKSPQLAAAWATRQPVVLGSQRVLSRSCLQQLAALQSECSHLDAVICSDAPTLACQLLTSLHDSNLAVCPCESAYRYPPRGME